MPTDLPERKRRFRLPHGCEMWVSGFLWGTAAGIVAAALIVLLSIYYPLP